MGIGPEPSANVLASRLLNVLLDGHQRYRDNPWPLWLRTIHAMRQWGVKWWDPTISAQAFGARLLMPLSHNLPIYLVRHSHYEEPLERLAKTLSPDGYVMDIGANVGDTAVLMRALGDWPIVCVEGDAVFLSYLRANMEGISDVRISPVFADSGISFNSVVRAAGTARLSTTRWPSRDRVPTRSLEEIHSEYGEGAKCVLVKIDTDGLDLLILHQSLAWLRRERPVLFLEYAPAWLKHYSSTAASELLLGLNEGGYGYVAAFTNLGVPFGAYELDVSGIETLTNEFSGSRSDFLDLAVFPSDQAGEDPGPLVKRLVGLSPEPAGFGRHRCTAASRSL
jgi:FkbM family methyltransferase